MKVVILAAGGATRMKPLSNIITKPMLPIGVKPIMKRILDSFYEIGFRNFVVVYGAAEKQIVPFIHQYESQYRIKISLVEQLKPVGMADAILLTKKSVFSNKDENLPFFIIAGDVLFPSKSLIQTLKTHLKYNAAATLPVVHSLDENMAISHGNLKIEGGIVKQIVEKPGVDKKIDDFYAMPIYIFNETFFDLIEKVELSSRGEKELQDAIQMLIDSNEVVAGVNLLPNSIELSDIGKYHITYPRDFLAINFHNSHEDVFFGENTIVGENCTILKSYIFPEVTVGDNTSLSECIVEKGVQIPAGSSYKQKIILKMGIFDL